MNWQELDSRMRDGAVLVFRLNFGAWLEVDGKWQVDVNRNAAKALRATKRNNEPRNIERRSGGRVRCSVRFAFRGRA